MSSTHYKFVDYLVILGYDSSQIEAYLTGDFEDFDELRPRILQRFPTQKWPYNDTLAHLCFPCGPVITKVTDESPDIKPPNFFVVVLKTETGHRKYGHVLSFNTFNKATNVLSSKCILLISKCTHLNITKQVLIELFELAQENEFLEPYIFNLLNEMHLPSPGSALKCAPAKSQLILYHPNHHEELSQCHIDLLKVIDNVGGPESFLDLVTALLIEKDIAIKSNTPDDIFNVFHALECCIKPFTYRFHVCLPVCENGPIWENFLHFPITHIIGYVADPFSSGGSSMSGSSACHSTTKCFVDLKNKTTCCGDKLPDLPFREKNYREHQKFTRS